MEADSILGGCQDEAAVNSWLPSLSAWRQV
ncbi:hypothetical protein KUCAC02_002678 [Chaenocephalus aceratus]|uniref:Uncharacterized protein n=1 Tax=Chaenocephalus aceratus TaxID=36190 RepID=A0ACB9XVI4_CHAAC|nr:hypothetical protein KUCAC02_002678 [Chaenocephalus aceratus]